MLPTLDDLAARRAPAAVCGLGFVGLHAAVALARSYRILAYDPDPARRDALRAGFDAAGEFSAARLAEDGPVFVASAAELADCRVIFLAAPVPPGAGGRPDPTALRAAAAEVGAFLRPGALVIVESPAPAAAIRAECAAALAVASRLTHGVDFHLAFSCGGIRADDRVYRITEPLRSVVGDSPVSGALAREFLAPCVDARSVPVSAQLGVAAMVTPPPPRREVIIGGLAAAQVMILPWMFGGQSLAAQWTAAGLALAAFLALFLPGAHERFGERVAAAWRTLRGSVPFWAGLSLMALFACQAANPRFSVEFDGRAWSLIAREYREWLPSGVESPFSLNGPPGGMNALRTLLIFSAPWLLFTALTCGVKSRRVTLGIWGALAATAVAVAVFAMATRLSESTWLFGTSTAGVGSPLGPFLYQNQGGAFLYLGFFATLGLALRLRDREAARISVSGPQGLAIAGCLIIAAGALMSASFAVAVVLALCPLAVVPAVYFTYARTRRRARTPVPALLAVAGLLALLFAVLVLKADFSGMVHKVKAKLDMARLASLDDRIALREATRLMYHDAPALTGAGAGSFRWLAPVYFAKVPALCWPDGGVKLAYYAHCDWLQVLVEWGVWGVVSLASLAVWFVARIRAGFVSTAACWPPVFGLTVLALHAGWDYLMYNPAVTLAATVTAFLVLALTRRRPRGTPDATPAPFPFSA